MTRVAQFVADVRAKLHRHRWQPSAWNRYGSHVERRCKCGVAQHHFACDLDWSAAAMRSESLGINWREGGHPNLDTFHIDAPQGGESAP